jgi:hypothetical protein
MTKLILSDDENLLKDYYNNQQTIDGVDYKYYCLKKPTLDFIENPTEFADLYDSQLLIAEILPRFMTYFYQKYPVKEVEGDIDVIDTNEDGTAIFKDGIVSTHKETGIVSTENTFEYIVLTKDPSQYYVKICICDESNIMLIN